MKKLFLPFLVGLLIVTSCRSARDTVFRQTDPSYRVDLDGKAPAYAE